jgi:hypothetical protein
MGRINWPIYDELLKEKLPVSHTSPNGRVARVVKVVFVGGWVGGDNGYGNGPIALAKALKGRFGLTYREVEKLLEELAPNFPTPDHSTLSRKGKKILPAPLPSGPCTIVVGFGGIEVREGVNGKEKGVMVGLDPEEGAIHIF